MLSLHFNVYPTAAAAAELCEDFLAQTMRQTRATAGIVTYSCFLSTDHATIYGSPYTWVYMIHFKGYLRYHRTSGMLLLLMNATVAAAAAAECLCAC